MATVRSVSGCCVIDSNGQCGWGSDRGEAVEDYEERYQPVGDAEGVRYIDLTLSNVLLPEPVEVTADMGETAGPVPTVSVG